MSRRGLLGVLAVAVLVAGCSGADGKNGGNGEAGANGANGDGGTPCWDLNNNGVADVSSEDANKDGLVDTRDCQGPSGPPGAGYLPLEPAGVVGFLRDTARRAVIGAKVYLVPAADIPTTALALTDITVERASTADEPLEDTIAVKGGGYTVATTDANGIYRIANVPAGAYFVVAVPTDKGHLPGGSLCRKVMKSTDLVGKQFDIEMSTTPSPKAEYVGPTVCLNCHGVTHEKQTAHMLGIRKIGKTGPLQDSKLFPDWNKALAKFSLGGTTLYYYAYNGNNVSPDWKVSEVDPGSGVSFTAKLYSDANGYWVDFTDVKGMSASAHYEVDISYGGGVYKQRYVTNIAGSRYVLPIQFNFDGQTDETQPYARWVWGQYNAQDWYDEAIPALKTPAKTKSFDNNCAGCHFTGYSLTGDSTAGFRAHAVPDVNGEMDFDGDGLSEAMNISCESCHGPGSEHWQMAGQGNAIVSPRLLTPEREVAICAQCHTRARGIGGANTEALMDQSGHMMMAGTSRKDFLTSFVSKLDDGLWDATKGDGKHAKKHHQQASDFIKSKKYRNSTQLVTCTGCHDPHGNTGLTHQTLDKKDSASAGAGLCMGCHDATYPQGANLGDREQTHYAGKNITNIAMGDIGCIDCHMAKTAKSGSGLKQATIQNATYYSGDISSHLFDVPRRSSIQTKAPDMMAIPYTSACAQGCHSAAP